LNKTVLIGNLGQDPELTYTPSGTAVCKFSIAVATWKKDTAPDWFNIVSWNKLAETCGTYLKKGQKVAVEGRIVVNKYTAKDGSNRTSYEIHINEMEMLSSKKEANEQDAVNSDEVEEHPF